MTDWESRRDYIDTAIVTGPNGPTNIERAMTEHLDWLRVRNYSPRTICVRHRQLTAFAAWLAEQEISEITQLDLAVMEGYQRRLHQPSPRMGRDRSVNTQYQHIVTLRSLVRFLHRTGRIATDPVAALELPRLERTPPKPVLTPEEVELVLAQPNIRKPRGLRDRAMLETMFATGIRRLELVTLTAGDIDRHVRTLTVRRGKGNRWRVVPISDRALHWIDRYLVEARPQLTSFADDGVLFITQLGRMFGLAYLSRRVNACLKAAGFADRGACHVFRATTATTMLDSGADIRYVQEMLGHASIMTTQLYTRVSIRSLQRVYDRTHPSAQAGAPEPDQGENDRVVALPRR